MGICFVLRVHDAGQDTIHVPDQVRSDPDSFTLSVCNGNGRELLLALGLSPDPADGDLPLDAFCNLVTAALRRRLGRRSPAVPSSIDAAPGRIPVIQASRPEGYIEGRLGDLARLTQRGRAIGVTHVAWN